MTTDSAHLDSTSFHLHGQYETTPAKVSFVTGEVNPNNLNWEQLEETVVPQPIHITHGYSRDHRPNLKQFILDLICSGDVPLFLRGADGNEADKAVFAQILGEFRQQLLTALLAITFSFP